MSSYVALCAAFPAFSCTFGPAGTLSSAGAGPRPVGTTLQTSVLLSRSQSHGSPAVALRRAAPLAFVAEPVAALATHSSTPSVRVLRNASFDPSGENFRFERLACGGTATLASPPASF